MKMVMMNARINDDVENGDDDDRDGDGDGDERSYK